LRRGARAVQRAPGRRGRPRVAYRLGRPLLHLSRRARADTLWL